MAFDEENAVEQASGRAMMDHRPPTVTEKLEQERNELELRLQAINELLEQLRNSPETQQILDGMAKLGRGMF